MEHSFDDLKKGLMLLFEEVGIFIDENEDDINLGEYNIDSISFISVIVSIEELYEIEIPDEYLNYAVFSSFNGFVGMIQGILQED